MLMRSLVALVALFAALGLWIAGLDHEAVFAILIAVGHIGAEVFAR